MNETSTREGGWGPLNKSMNFRVRLILEFLASTTSEPATDSVTRMDPSGQLPCRIMVGSVLPGSVAQTFAPHLAYHPNSGPVVTSRAGFW